MSYHGLGAGLNLNVSVSAGGGSDGTSPSGCKTTQYGITGCDDCNKNANAYCCAQHGGPTGKQSVDTNTGAFWADCKNGVRAARKAYGSQVQWFMPGTGMPPPPPPPPSGGLTGIAAALANVQYQAQLSAWMGKMGKPAPAPAAIKVIGGSGGNRPAPAGSPAAKSPVVGGGGWNKGPTGTATGKVAGSGSSGGSQSSAPSESLLADLNRAIGKAAGSMVGSATGKAPAPSTPVVGQGAIVSTYEATPPVTPTLPVERIIDPSDAGWSTGQLVAVGVAALLVAGGAAYFISQRSAA